MSFDLVVRTLGVVACLYTVAYFITSMSVAALNAVTYSSGPMCGQTGCITVAREERIDRGEDRTAGEEPMWLTAFVSLD